MTTKQKDYQFSPLQLQWLEYLEDHPEQQTTGTLGRVIKEKEYFCCLGAGAKVCGVKYQKATPIHEATALEFGPEKCIDYLSPEVQMKLKLRGIEGQLKLPITLSFFEEKMSSLAEMNDKEVSWPEIAKYIRENPYNVFVEEPV